MSDLIRSTPDEARRRVDRIRGHVASAWEEVIAAYKHRDHEALGYGAGQSGWDAYILGEFGESRLSLPRHQRVSHVIEAHNSGMSNRGISSVANVTEGTIRNDLKSQVRNFYAPDPSLRIPDANPTEGVTTNDTPEPKITGMDGKQYARPTPQEPPKPKRRPLMEQAQEAEWELVKAIERIERIVNDDRFTANKEVVTPHLRGHLTNAIDSCQGLLDRISN